MAGEVLLNKIQDLSDLELAVILCLTAQEHCIIDTEPDALDDVVAELRLVASSVFGLSHSVVECTDVTTLDDFVDSVIADPGVSAQAESPMKARQDSYFLQSPGFRSISRSPLSVTSIYSKKIASIIIAKNLDEAPKQIQIQTLELMRTKRLYTHTSVQSAPKQFLIIALIAGGEGPRLTKHLNDYMFISHFHDPEDGYPNLADLENDGDSVSSVVRKSATSDQTGVVLNPVFSTSDIESLNRHSTDVIISAEIQRYIHNIISFLRFHRAVQGGISAVATKHFDKLAKCLASFHGLTFVTPSLVAMAAKKIYPHRIQMTTPANERSMQWGSDLDAVAAALEELGPDDIIDDVIGTVEVP